MRAVTPNIALNGKITGSLRFILNPLVLLVLLSFLFQSFYPANGSLVDAGNSGIHPVTGEASRNSLANTLVHTQSPPKAAVLLAEPGLTSEDEDEKRNPFTELFKTFPGNLPNYEGGYNNYLKHRFSHLKSQINNRPAIAYFILYHSWKSDLRLSTTI